MENEMSNQQDTKEEGFKAFTAYRTSHGRSDVDTKAAWSNDLSDAHREQWAAVEHALRPKVEDEKVADLIEMLREFNSSIKTVWLEEVASTLEALASRKMGDKKAVGIIDSLREYADTVCDAEESNILREAADALEALASRPAQLIISVEGKTPGQVLWETLWPDYPWHTKESSSIEKWESYASQFLAAMGRACRREELAVKDAEIAKLQDDCRVWSKSFLAMELDYVNEIAKLREENERLLRLIDFKGTMDTAVVKAHAAIKHLVDARNLESVKLRIPFTPFSSDHRLGMVAAMGGEKK